MPFFITKINSASTNVSYNYLGTEAVWGILVSASYEFDISDLSYTDNDDVLYQGIDALNQVYLQKNIVGKIGSNEIRNGLVTSIGYPESPSVGKTTASISIEERIRVNDHGGLSDILDNVPSPQDVESFSESFSFQRGQKTYSRSRNVTLKYKQDAGDFFIQKAKIFVQSMFFDSRPAFGYQTDGISENARFNVYLKPLITENINLLTKEISFSETVSTNIINDSEIFAETYSQDIKINESLDERGYITKSYNVILKALKEPLELNILNAIADFLNATYQENSEKFKYPISVSRTINSEGGIANISIVFSNDPSLNAITNATYSVSKSNQGSWASYSFNITITSKGPFREASFNASKNYWKSNSNIGISKIQTLFNETSEIYEISRSTQFDEFQKSITESIVFSTDPVYKPSGIINKKTISISDQKGVDRHEIVGILGEKEYLRKRKAGKTLSSRSVSVNVAGKTFDSLEGQALQIAESLIPNAAYYYLNSRTSSHDPLNGSSTASITFNYFD